MADADRRGSDDGEAVTQSAGAAKQKSSLVLAAERAGKATHSGYLRKLNSAQQWQKRFFEIIGGRYWVYRKSSAPTAEILCAMDLWRSGPPAVLPPGDHGDAVFSIVWDRYRLFRAATREEAETWVRQMRMAQSNRPPDMAAAAPAATAMPAFATPGGALAAATPAPPPAAAAATTTAQTQDWSAREKAAKQRQQQEAVHKADTGCACTIM